ncbi:hypothetical protein [Roseobacter denitrificans]|nr:hypothetical protein [Roseobacter denitrificans]SFG03512.1 hypothetical protein SAMN05443635_10655 [Roseobacter denitrificans OCh 114]
MSSHMNSFLTGPISPIYARTAPPVIFVMGVTGLRARVDALCAGHLAKRQSMAAMSLRAPRSSMGFNCVLICLLDVGAAGSVGALTIWHAVPLAEGLLVGLTGLAVVQRAPAQALRGGLFTTAWEGQA